MNNPIFKAVFFLTLVVVFTFAARLARDFIRLCQGKDLRFSVQGMEGLEYTMLDSGACDGSDFRRLDSEEKLYIATALVMPYDKVCADIMAHDQCRSMFGGGRLLDDLVAKYKMDEPTVARRIREVRAMMRAGISITGPVKEVVAA